jgi:nitric oxide synthase-interacting protein
MRRFDACALCLNGAREPLACNEGHLFCKECVYTDLLTQKKDIKRQKDKLEGMKKDAENERTKVKEAARERVLEEFEKGQLGLAIAQTTGGTKSGGNADEPRGTKRKFAFDSSTVESLAKEAEESALIQIEKDQAAALKHKLPDFWLPSLTPTYTSNGPPQSLMDVKLQTTCRGGNPSHPLSLKTLIPVKFTLYSSSSRSEESTAAEDESKVKKDAPEPICPSCKKQLSNSVLIFLAKPCAHVTCKTCTDTLRPAKQCIVCDTQLKEKDILELKREGTGFAGGGLAETSKAGVAFQG